MTESVNLPDDLPVLGEMRPHHMDTVTLSNNPRSFASFSLTHAEHFVAIYVATQFLSFSFQAIDLHVSDEKKRSKLKIKSRFCHRIQVSFLKAHV